MHGNTKRGSSQPSLLFLFSVVAHLFHRKSDRLCARIPLVDLAGRWSLLAGSTVMRAGVDQVAPHCDKVDPTAGGGNRVDGDVSATNWPPASYLPVKCPDLRVVREKMRLSYALRCALCSLRPHHHSSRMREARHAFSRTSSRVTMF